MDLGRTAGRGAASTHPPRSTRTTGPLSLRATRGGPARRSGACFASQPAEALLASTPVVVATVGKGDGDQPPNATVIGGADVSGADDHGERLWQALGHAICRKRAQERDPCCQAPALLGLRVPGASHLSGAARLDRVDSHQRQATARSTPRAIGDIQLLAGAAALLCLRFIRGQVWPWPGLARRVVRADRLCTCRLRERDPHHDHHGRAGRLRPSALWRRRCRISGVTVHWAVHTGL